MHAIKQLNNSCAKNYKRRKICGNMISSFDVASDMFFKKLVFFCVYGKVFFCNLNKLMAKISLTDPLKGLHCSYP